MGVTLALPLLDAMLPAQTLLKKTAAAGSPRMGFVYVPHGAIMDKWTPAAEGAGFEFSPILKPLEPFRDRVNVVSGLGTSRGRQHGGALAESDHLAERRAAEAHPGRGRLRRRHGGSDCGAAHRAGYAAAVD